MIFMVKYAFVVLCALMLSALISLSLSQWGANNAWSQSGCPSGMCLRSGVNFTETYVTLTMI